MPQYILGSKFWLQHFDPNSFFRVGGYRRQFLLAWKRTLYLSFESYPKTYRRIFKRKWEIVANYICSSWDALLHDSNALWDILMTIIVVGDENCICSEHRRLQLPPSWESRTRVELNLAQEVNIWGKPSPPPAVYHQLVHWTELLYIVCCDHVRRNIMQRWWSSPGSGRCAITVVGFHCVALHSGTVLHCIAQWNYELHCIALHSGTVLHCNGQWNYISHCIALHSGTICCITLHCVQSMLLTIAAVRLAQLRFTLQCLAWYITYSALH